MSDVSRIVEALIAGDVPLRRDELTAAASRLAADVAPLADSSTIVTAVDSLVGLGPVEALAADPSVTDILINGPHDVWVERNGNLERTEVSFASNDDVVALVRRLISGLGLRIDRASPAVDARLGDGSRLHAVVPPAAVENAVVAIRRFNPGIGSLGDLVELGAATEQDAARLEQLVSSRANVLVVGPTGAGKTTLLNVLCSLVPEGERLIVIEDAAELQIRGHAVRLEARGANAEGAGDVTVRSLVRHALRLRPDRIVVGEVRGPEALDMVQALTTGHRGSMSTIHAHTTAEALARLTTLASMAPERVPHRALDELVGSAFDAVVTVDRRRGDRRIAAIDVVGGIE